MSLRTKLITVPTVLAVVAISAIWMTTTSNSDDNYAFSVTWKPGVLSTQNPVRITATVDGVPLLRRTRHVSPWGETMTATPGAVVTLSAWSAHPSVFFVDCLIMLNGNAVPGKGYAKRAGPGAVECSG